MLQVVNISTYTSRFTFRIFQTINHYQFGNYTALNIKWEETQDLKFKKRQALSTRTTWVCLPPGSASCDCWLEGRGCVFVFETTAQTGNILQHSGAPQYWTFMRYPSRQAHVLVICKAPCLERKTCKVETGIIFQALKNQPTDLRPPFVLYLDHLVLMFVQLLCSSCIRCECLLPRCTR